MQLNEILAMNVPSTMLKEVISKHNIESKKTSAEIMARALSHQNEKVGQELASQFQFAGATAISLNIAVSGINSEWSNKDYFMGKLKEKFGDEILTQGLHPILSKEPQIIAAYNQKDKVVIALSYLGNPYREWNDFQIVRRKPQIVEYAMIHFSPFTIETRTNLTRNEKFKNAILDFMDFTKDSKIKWDKATKLTNVQAIELAKLLGANLRSAKHKMTEGPFATMEVTAIRDIDDLENTEQYIRELSTQPMKSKTLFFEYTYKNGFKQKVSYAVNDKGIWIKTNVGEEVIEFIVESIKQIRYPNENEEEAVDEFDEELDFDEEVDE